MGASTSTEQKVSAEQRETESLAASVGALPMLQKAFSKFADSHSNAVSIDSLQRCFCLTYKKPSVETSEVPEQFLGMLDQLGSSIVDIFFIPDKGGFSWVEFLRGYNKCSGRTSTSISLNTLLRVFAATAAKSGFSLELQFESEDADCKISGSFLPKDVLMLIWICWAMWSDCKNLKFLKRKANLCLMDVNHLVLSAVVSCAEVTSGLSVWDCDISGLDVKLPVGKFLSWALKTLPSLADCLGQFVHARLENSVTQEDELDSSSSSVGDISALKSCNSRLLTCGTAWAISLTMRSTISEELSRLCLFSNDDGTNENILFRSSLHGRGLSRFWSNIEGYQGPMLILISATSGDAQEGSSDERKWIIGVLIHQAFENKNVFYGSSGILFAISPVFHVYPSIGKEKNFIYSHVRPTVKSYDPHPKPVGIAFGGSMGNERIFVDDDFARVTVRHHAVDKTYQPGSLFPDQGFLPVEALVVEVEAWGLGGNKAKELQNAHKKREQLFTDQRRQVDLKTFGNWEDSPEKIMMDMVSDPSAVRREDR